MSSGASAQDSPRDGVQSLRRHGTALSFVPGNSARLTTKSSSSFIGDLVEGMLAAAWEELYAHFTEIAVDAVKRAAALKAKMRRPLTEMPSHDMATQTPR